MENKSFTTNSTKNTLNRKLIPSQRVVGSNKELFIIKFEGSVLEIHRTNNLYEPLVVQLNGVTIDTIPSKQNKEIVFNLEDGSAHKLEVWNERLNNSPFLKLFMKDGIAIVIDGIPVQNSLADPLTGLSRPKFFLWLLSALLFFISIVIPIIKIQEGYKIEYSVFLVGYIFLFVLALVATLTFQANPIRSVWIAISISALELIYTFYLIITYERYDLYSILFLALRLSILFSLFYSLKYLRSILDVSEVDRVETNKAKSEIKKRNKKKIFTLRRSIILGVSLIVAVGLYFAVNQIIIMINEPSIDRDSSLEFRSDLKLPELIPYRKGNKWGYSNKNGNIIIQPQYSSAPLVNNEDKYITLEKNGLKGIIDRKGNNIIPFVYNYIIKQDSNDIFIVKKGFYGVVDSKNKILVPLIYEDLVFANDLLVATGHNEGKKFWSIITLDNKVKYLRYDLGIERALSKNVFLAYKTKSVIDISGQNRKIFYGLIDQNGKILLPVEYNIDFPLIFNSNVAYYNISKKDYSGVLKDMEERGISFERAMLIAPTKYGMMNSSGQIIVPALYDQIDWNIVSGKYIRAKKNNKWGMFDINGKQILPFSYNFIAISKFKDKYFFTINDNTNRKAGIISEDGEAIFPYEYDWVYLNENNDEKIYSIQNNNRYGAVDSNQRLIVQPISINPVRFEGGLAKVKLVKQETIDKILNSKDLRGQEFINKIHTGLWLGWEVEGIEKNPYYAFKDNNAQDLKNYLSDSFLREMFYENNEFYLKNFTGSYENFLVGLMLPNRYDWYNLPGKYGYYNSNGKLVADFVYDDANNFSNGCAEVSIAGKWGYIDKNGESITDLIYDKTNEFHNGYAIVNIGEKWGVIDKNGEVVINLVYDKIKLTEIGFFEVRYKNKWGVINNKNQVVLPIKYDELNLLKNYSLAKVKFDDKSGYIDFNGVKYFSNE